MFWNWRFGGCITLCSVVLRLLGAVSLLRTTGASVIGQRGRPEPCSHTAGTAAKWMEQCKAKQTVTVSVAGTALKERNQEERERQRE